MGEVSSPPDVARTQHREGPPTPCGGLAPRRIAASTGRPRKARARGVLLVLTVGYVCAVVIAVTVTHFLGDRHPIAGILLYGPRWPLLAAAVPVLLGQLALRRWGQLGITTASAA